MLGWLWRAESMRTGLIMVIIVCGTVSAVSTQSEDSAKRAQRLARQYRAVAQINRFITQGEFYSTMADLLDDQLQKDVEKHLTYDAKIADNTMYQMGEMALTKEIQSLCDQFDPNDEYGVRSLLESRANKVSPGGGMTLGEQIRTKIKEDLRKGKESRLLQAYRQSRIEFSRMQIKEVLSDLSKDPNLLPQEEQIIEVINAPDKREKTIDSVNEALTHNRTDLLYETREALAKEARGLVENGVAEYHRQRRVVEQVRCRSLTKGGIRDELIESLSRDLDERKGSPDSRDRRIYRFFQESGSAIMEHEVRKRLQERIKSTVDEMGDWDPAGQTAEYVRERISKSPTRYHTFGQNIEELRKFSVNAFIAELAVQYKKRVDKEDVSSDKPKYRDRVQDDIMWVLAKPWGQWNQVRDNVCDSFDASLKQIRGDLAARQVEQWCPLLAAWHPTSRVLRDHALDKLDRSHVKRLLIWDNSPPANDQLILDETWEMVIRAVRMKLQLGHEAMTAQENCVESVRPEMARRIQQDCANGEDLDTSIYYDLYIAKLRERWRSHVLSRQQDELFEEVETHVLDIVKSLVNTERTREINKREDDIGNVQPDDVTLSMLKDKAWWVRIVGPVSSEMRDELQKAADIRREELIVLWQNRIVDEVKPGIEREVEGWLLKGKGVSQNEVSASFVQEVREEWARQARDLESEDRDIRKSVQERIAGIVEALIPNVNDLIKTIRSMQLDLVEKQRPAMVRQITSERERRQSRDKKTYCSEYEQRVLGDWRRNTLATHTNSLLPETCTQIRGNVDAAIGSAVIEAQKALVSTYYPEIEKDAQAATSRGKYTQFDPLFTKFRDLVLSSWQQHPLSDEHSKLHPEVETQIRGLVQKLTNAQRAQLGNQVDDAIRGSADPNTFRVPDLRDSAAFQEYLHRRLGWPVPEDKLPAVDKRWELVREEVIVLWQNRIVDEVRPRIAADIESKLRNVETISRDNVFTSFLRQVTEEWCVQARGLEPKDQEIRSSVQERIEGIVATMVDHSVPKKVLEDANDVEKRGVPIHYHVSVDVNDRRLTPESRREYADRYVETVWTVLTTGELQALPEDLIHAIRKLIRDYVNGLIHGALAKEGFPAGGKAGAMAAAIGVGSAPGSAGAGGGPGGVGTGGGAGGGPGNAGAGGGAGGGPGSGGAGGGAGGGPGSAGAGDDVGGGPGNAGAGGGAGGGPSTAGALSVTRDTAATVDSIKEYSEIRSSSTPLWAWLVLILLVLLTTYIVWSRATSRTDQSRSVPIRSEKMSDGRVSWVQAFDQFTEQFSSREEAVLSLLQIAHAMQYLKKASATAGGLAMPPGQSLNTFYKRHKTSIDKACSGWDGRPLNQQRHCSAKEIGGYLLCGAVLLQSQKQRHS